MMLIRKAIYLIVRQSYQYDSRRNVHLNHICIKYELVKRKLYPVDKFPMLSSGDHTGMLLLCLNDLPTRFRFGPHSTSHTLSCARDSAKAITHLAAARTLRVAQEGIHTQNRTWLRTMYCGHMPEQWLFSELVRIFNTGVALVSYSMGNGPNLHARSLGIPHLLLTRQQRRNTWNSRWDGSLTQFLLETTPQA